MSKLDEIESYLSKMTPGEWHVATEGFRRFNVYPKGQPIAACIAPNYLNAENNAHGIAALRSDAEYLVRRCRELEKAIRTITGCHNREALLVAVAEAERVLKEGE